MLGITEGKRPLGIPRCEWNDAVKIDHEEIGWDGVDWINVAEYKNIREVVVHTAT